MRGTDTIDTYTKSPSVYYSRWLDKAITTAPARLCWAGRSGGRVAGRAGARRAGTWRLAWQSSHSVRWPGPGQLPAPAPPPPPRVWEQAPATTPPPLPPPPPLAATRARASHPGHSWTLVISVKGSLITPSNSANIDSSSPPHNTPEYYSDIENIFDPPKKIFVLPWCRCCGWLSMSWVVSEDDVSVCSS